MREPRRTADPASAEQECCPLEAPERRDRADRVGGHEREPLRAVAAADGILLVSPEHNASVSALLKNAVDWTSRPQGAIQGKPVALAGATPGGFGTLRGQIAWRQTLANLGVPLLASSALLVSGAGEKFDADGNLTHQQTRDDLVALLVAFAAWIERLRA